MCDSFRISEFDVKKSSGMQQNHSQNVSRWWSKSLQDCSQNGVSRVNPMDSWTTVSKHFESNSTAFH